MTSEERLLSRLTFATDEEVLRIIRSPEATVNVLLQIANTTVLPGALSAILESPLLNERLFYAVFKANIDLNNSRVFLKLLRHEILTAEMFNEIAKLPNLATSVKVELIKSKFATEDICIKIISYYKGTLYSSGKEEIANQLFESPHMSSNILNEIIDIAETDELMKKCLTSSYLTYEQYKKIVNLVIVDQSTYRNSATELFNSKYLNGEIISMIMDNYSRLVLRNLSKVLSSPICDKNVLLSLLEKTTSLSTLRQIIDHQAVDKEVLEKAVAKLEVLKVGESYSTIREIYIQIIKNQACDEKIILEIIKSDNSQEIINAIKQLPNISKKVKIAVLASKRNLTEEDVNEILSVDGLTESDYLTFIELLPKKYVIPKLLEKDVLSTPVYLKMIPEIRELAKPEYNYRAGREVPGPDYMPKLLERDLPEAVLIEIAKTEKKLEAIKVISAHKNAGMGVSTVLRVIAENFGERDSKVVYQLAEDVKRRVLRGVFTVEEEETVTDMLRANIEDGLSTMLWGPSGVGKSSRVFEIDPTATMLILKNGMLPEEVIGGKEPNGEPGEIYPPHWYVVLCEKCKKEPNRKHVLFIDEFTNVSDTIKNLVWEVIGNRLVNGHEEWPLPENCSIVVAGNRPEESTAVRIDSAGGVMPAPLHNRIDSMIEIKFDIDEWQKWALETDPKTSKLRIHPIVYSFCVAHAEEVMFTNYNPEDVTAPFLSPRKWETLSKAIYKAEERGEMHHISDARIKSIIGNNSIAEAFIAHYERLPIDMERIEQGDYIPEDFYSTEDRLYALGIVIAKYEGDEMAIESFIVECLGEEYYSIYKSMKSLKQSVKEQTKKAS